MLYLLSFDALSCSRGRMYGWLIVLRANIKRMKELTSDFSVGLAVNEPKLSRLGGGEEFSRLPKASEVNYSHASPGNATI